MDIKELEKKAEAGDAEAQYDLGWMYDWGESVKQDYEKAASWYEKAADQGSYRRSMCFRFYV